MSDYIEYLPPWLRKPARGLDEQLRQNALPHALLIHGPAGTGRGWLAAWLAHRLVETEDPGRIGELRNGLDDPEYAPTHPDLMLVRRLPDKQTTQIDSVRSMIEFLQLTSHEGGARLALVPHSETLTEQAANAMLKTLEEPPAAAHIVLIASTASRLRDTVISRCHRVRVTMPARAAAATWLGEQNHHADWQTVLDLASGAPLLALELQSAGFDRIAVQMRDEIGQLEARTVNPVTVAHAWTRRTPEYCLRWLYVRACDEIREMLMNPSKAPLQNPEKTLNITRCFDYLAEIRELRRLQGRGHNVELNWIDLLSRWYGGFGRA